MYQRYADPAFVAETVPLVPLFDTAKVGQRQQTDNS